jgi:hypothetical protein
MMHRSFFDSIIDPECDQFLVLIGDPEEIVH